MPWDAEGGGGGMLGGVERGCVFTSAGESGISAAFFSFLSTAVRGAGRGEKEKASEAGGEGRGQRLPSHTSCLKSPSPQLLGLRLCCWGPRCGLPSWTQGGSVSAHKARSGPRAWPIPDKPQVCSQVADISPTWDHRVGLGQPISGRLQEP